MSRQQLVVLNMVNDLNEVVSFGGISIYLLLSDFFLGRYLIFLGGYTGHVVELG